MSETAIRKKNVKRRVYAVLALAVVLLGAMFATGYFRNPGVNPDVIDKLKPFTHNDRILVFAPHCDDEALGAGGLIQQALAAGAAVRVVIVTNGDNSFFSTRIESRKIRPKPKNYIEAGHTRMQESVKALEFLGLDRRGMDFLCYPDKGIKALFLTNWPDHNPYRSNGTKEEKPPYQGCYNQDALYSGNSLSGDITEIIADFKPSIIVTPHPDDQHPDHVYTYEFVKLSVRELYGGARPGRAGKAPLALAYLVHHKYFPQPKGFKPEEPLLPPIHTNLFNANWVRVPLTIEQRDAKYDALRLYKTQIVVPRLGGLMRSFVRVNELFEQFEMSD